MDWNYRAFMLDISSNILLGALHCSTSEREPDLGIMRGSAQNRNQYLERMQKARVYKDRLAPESPLRIWRGLNDEAFLFEYDDGTWFHLDRVTWRIVTGWPPEYTADDMATYLLGPVMGFVLRLKGVACLHASSAAIGGHAIAFVGNSGAGKSTLAAAFALGGLPILGDDIVAIDEKDDVFMVRPGYARLRLWPDSAAGLLGDADRLPHISPSWDKRHLDLAIEGRQFHDQPAPLGAIYLLGDRADDDTAGGFERLAPAEALIALVAHGYVSYLLDRAMQAHEFEVLSRVAARIPVWRAHPPADMRQLPGFCDRMLAHIGTHA